MGYLGYIVINNIKPSVKTVQKNVLIFLLINFHSTQT